MTLDMRSPKLSGSCAVSLFQQMTTHPTVRITVGEVNVLGVGRVKIDRGSLWCVIGDVIPENCVEFFRALNNSGLKVSTLNVQDLTDRTAEHFAVRVAESQSVQALKLKHCNITSAGAVSIFRSLEHNTSLEELDLSGNSQLPAGDSEAVGCAIERMLNVNRTLKVLNLCGCELTNEVASYFSNGLAQNHSVRRVILRSNNTGRTSAMSIFGSLEHNTSLEELDLSGNSQLAEGDSEAVGCAIEKMLSVNRTLKVLNLSGCNVTDPIVKHILTGLMKNTSIVTLHMGSPKLSGSCAVPLFQQMTTHPTLSRVHVGEVNVPGVGRVKMDGRSLWFVVGDMIPENCVEFFRALNNSGLKVSKLNVRNLTAQTAEHFSIGLAESQSVLTLKLKLNSISSIVVGSIALEHNTSLEELDLSDNSQLAEGDSEAVGCAIAKMLKINKTLKVLCLTNCGLDTVVATHIFKSLEFNTSLEEFDFSENSQLAEGDSEVVGCAIERMLSVNKTLKVLNLNDCRLTNEVASYFANGLAQNHSVRKVILHSNNIGSTGTVSIFTSLEHNTSLEELDLSENSQLAEGDSEAVGCAIERMLNVNRTLKVLNLSGCNITDPIVKHILTGLTKNTSLVTLEMRSLKLSGSCAVSLFQLMTTHPTVSITVGEVNVLGVGRATMDRGSLWCVVGDTVPENCVEFFRALNNSGLKVSTLNVQDLTDQTVEHFSIGLTESQSILTLKLKLNSISSIGVGSIFRSLQHNASLEQLDLSGNSQLAEGDSEAVGCAIERMLNVNRTLKVLNLSGCRLDTAVGTSIFQSLQHNTSLEELYLSGNSQLVEGDSKVVGDAIERMMNVNKTLKLLNLSGCRLDTAVANHIVAGLVKNDYLIQLNIERNCYITSEGWVHVFKALCNNTPLKKLDINVNNVRMEGSVALVEMLSLNKSLTELSLQDCLIPEAGLGEIARGLLKNTSLKKLDITHNKLGIGGSVALAEMLSCNKSLTELNLRWCDIPEAGLREIPKGLLKNTSLKKLDISRNKLGMEGSVALAEMLSCNKSLTELDLERCDIPEAGLREIARGLLQNTSLKKLDISGNKLGMEGSVALAEMLSCNKSLTELNLGWCDIPEAGLREIARGLLQNTSLQTINLEQKAFLEAEIERLKKSGNFTPQSSSRLEIKYWLH